MRQQRATLQTQIIKEFGSAETQKSYIPKAENGLWPSEQITILRYFTPGATVLDIGCGTGRTTIPLHQLGYQVLGIDITPEMIENAKKIATNKKLTIPYTVGDATQLNYQNNSFANAIFSHNGFGQIPGQSNRSRALKEIYRVLQPNGFFILICHVRHQRDVRWFWIKRWLQINFLKPLGAPVAEIEFGDYIFPRYINGKKTGKTQFMHIANARILERQITDAGFNIVFAGREHEVTTEDVHDQDNVYNFAPMFYVCQK